MFKKLLLCLIFLQCNWALSATQTLLCKLEVKRDFKQNENTETKTERFTADVSTEIFTNEKLVRIKVTQGEKVLALAIFDTNEESYSRFNSKNESDESKWNVSNQSIAHLDGHRLFEETSVFIDRRTGVMSFSRKLLIDSITKISDFGNGVCNKVDANKRKF